MEQIRLIGILPARAPLTMLWGILLVEAKAHNEELNNEMCGKSLDCRASDNSIRNHERIGNATNQASIALTDQTGNRWALSRDHRYQMSNRFAWAWKLMELGYPVILVYLGFLEADEMQQGKRRPLANHDEWGTSRQVAQRVVVFRKGLEPRLDCPSSPLRPAYLLCRDILRRADQGDYDEGESRPAG